MKRMTYWIGCGLWLGCTAAPAQTAYAPTLSSLETHPLPDWYQDAKLGVMVTWGLYSVPGWAPVKGTNHEVTSPDYFRNNPYAEWYYNSMRVPGSPTAEYHREHFGDAEYYGFTKAFTEASRQWNPEQMTRDFSDAGVKYVVFITKFHDGYSLWPSSVINPNQAGLTSSRDSPFRRRDCAARQDRGPGLDEVLLQDAATISPPIVEAEASLDDCDCDEMRRLRGRSQ